jgi:hypothetical protein
MAYMYAPNQVPTEYPYSTSKLKRDNPGVSFPKTIPPSLLLEYNVYPVVDEKPAFNNKTQKLVMDDISTFPFTEGLFYTQYTVTDLTEEEFNLRQPSDDRISQTASTKLLKTQFEQITVPLAEVNDFASLYPSFRVGEAVVIGNRRKYEEEVWECLQAHTTQLDWLPPDVPALWKRVFDPDVIQDWVQPTGAQDAYDIGEQVLWVGKVWESTITANTTVPGENTEHGYWVEVTA